MEDIKEQAICLSNFTIPNHHIIYMVEGDIDQYKANTYSKHKITSKTLRSSIVFYIHQRFSVIFTKNTQDTANWIIQFAEKIYKNGLKGHYNDNEKTNYIYRTYKNEKTN